MAKTTRISVAVALMACVLAVFQMPAAHAQGYPNVPAALRDVDEFSTSAQVFQALGLFDDKVFAGGRWESVVYVPTNDAWANFFKIRKTNAKAWIAADKKAALYTALQHFVSTYILDNFDTLYNGQRQASLLTLLNHRSRLTISIDKQGQYWVAAAKSAALLSRNLIRVGAPHQRLTIIAVNSVLIPDLSIPPAPAPLYNTVWDVITQLPGLEDYHYALRTALKVNPGLQATLSNPNATFTVMAPNAEGLRYMRRLLGVKADVIMNDAILMDRVVRYHIVPGVKYSAEDLLTHRKFASLIPNRSLHMVFFNLHTVVAGNQLATDVSPNHGKFWNTLPKPLPSIMPQVDPGTWDMVVGKSMIHVMDSFLVPKPDPKTARDINPNGVRTLDITALFV